MLVWGAEPVRGPSFFWNGELRTGSGRPTHRATCDSCSLVRFRGWLKARIPNWLGSAPAGRLALRMPLWTTLMKAPMLCQPLLLNQIWGKSTAPVQGHRKQRAGLPAGAALTFTLLLVSKPLMKPDRLSRKRSAAAPWKVHTRHQPAGRTPPRRSQTVTHLGNLEDLSDSLDGVVDLVGWRQDLSASGAQ